MLTLTLTLTLALALALALPRTCVEAEEAYESVEGEPEHNTGHNPSPNRSPHLLRC